MASPPRQRTVVDEVLSWAGGRFYPNPNYTSAYLSSYARSTKLLAEEGAAEDYDYDDDYDDDYDNDDDGSRSPPAQDQGRRKRRFSEDLDAEDDGESGSFSSSGGGSSSTSSSTSNESDGGGSVASDDDDDESTHRRPRRRKFHAWNRGLRQRPSTPTGEGGRGGVLPFPEVAYNMIREVAAEDPTLIAWVHDGEAFEIRDTGERLTPTLEKYFQHTKYSSFQRQLNMYGWHKCTKGKYRGAFHNPNFHRDMDEKDLQKIERRRPPPVGKKAKRKREAKRDVVRKEFANKTKRKKKGHHHSAEMSSRAKAYDRKTTSGDGKEPKKKGEPKRGGWSDAEDDMLRSLVASYDARSKPYKWMKMASCMKGRSGKQCRERWHNHLRPDLKKGNWTQEEDELIMTLHDELGNQWTKIASHVPGRSDNDVKNRFHARMKKSGEGERERRR